MPLTGADGPVPDRRPQRRIDDRQDPLATELLVIATENAELRLQLAEAQNQCVEPAVDGGEMHAETEALRAQIAEAERYRDAWWVEAERLSGHGARKHSGSHP